MGFENIWEHDGLGIAATGMIIVFVALTLIALFISLLPRLLTSLGDFLPPEHDAPPSRPSPSVDDEMVAAIGFVLHQIDLQKSDRN